jgi:hypothetical protein
MAFQAERKVANPIDSFQEVVPDIEEVVEVSGKPQ